MAVYTEVPDDELAKFIASYDLGALLSYKGIAEGVENTNYLVHTEKGPFFLTLYEKRVAPATCPFFLGLMEHLAQAGLTCPTPCDDGQRTHAAQAGGQACALVTFLKGVWIRRPQARHCWAVGAGDGAAASGRPRASSLPAPTPWDLRAGDRSMPASRARAEEVAPRARRHHRAGARPSGRPTGRPTCRRASSTPISFRTTSSSSATSSSGLIDFYFACNDAFAYDVAVTLNAWCFETDHALQHHQGPGAAQGLPRRAHPERAERAGAAAAGARGGAALPAHALPTTG